jgi:hypothetical protein
MHAQACSYIVYSDQQLLKLRLAWAAITNIATYHSCDLCDGHCWVSACTTDTMWHIAHNELCTPIPAATCGNSSSNSSSNRSSTYWSIGTEKLHTTCMSTGSSNSRMYQVDGLSVYSTSTSQGSRMGQHPNTCVECYIHIAMDLPLLSSSRSACWAFLFRSVVCIVVLRVQQLNMSLWIARVLDQHRWWITVISYWCHNHT